MPIDAAPSPDGGVVIEEIDGVVKAFFPSKHADGFPPGTPHHKSHFATCPNAQKHRKPR